MKVIEGEIVVGSEDRCFTHTCAPDTPHPCSPALAVLHSAWKLAGQGFTAKSIQWYRGVGEQERGQGIEPRLWGYKGTGHGAQGTENRFPGRGSGVETYAGV